MNQIFLLPLFYTFPAEVVAKSDFRDLPRNFHTALTDAQSLERIQSKQFLKDMIDMTAAMVWMHLGHRGWIEVYSGYSPAYVCAHMLNHWRNLFYTVYREINPIMLTDRIPHRLGIWTNSADYRIDWERFIKSLAPAEREIIELRQQRKTQTEIAAIMGYKTHSAVQKKLVKLRNKYEQWFNGNDETAAIK